jgi:hypothetical protein
MLYTLVVGRAGQILAPFLGAAPEFGPGTTFDVYCRPSEDYKVSKGFVHDF